MGRRPGPPALPVEAKRRRGNPGHQKLPNPITAIEPFVLVEAAADAPTDGEALGQALLEAGASAWIGRTDQLAVLRLVQDAWDQRAFLRDFIAKNGWSYENGTGRWFPRPEVVALDNVEKRLTVWLSQLGLTPADRGRLGLAEVKARSKMEEMRERRAQRLAGRPAG